MSPNDRPVPPSDDPDELRRRLVAAEAQSEHLRAMAEAGEGLSATVFELRVALARSEAELAAAAAELRNLQDRTMVRYSGRLARAIARARAALSQADDASAAVARPEEHPPTPLVEPSAAFPYDPRYPTWVEYYDTPSDAERSAITRRLGQLSDPPLVSVIMPVFDPPERYLRQAIESVRAQIYEHWELCIADDASTEPWVAKVLSEYAAEDARIKVERRSVNGHISASSNTAIGMASGSWIACFDHDDLMAEHALATAVLSLAEHPGAGLLYSDEDHVDDAGNRTHPYFKPDFDPVLLLGQNYLSHLCMLRRDLVDEVGGYREGFEGSQDWDLVLRVSERLEASQVVHVPRILYHWRAHPGSTASSLSAKPYAATAGQRAVTEHLGRQAQAARVLTMGASSFNRIEWSIPDPVPLVSVVVLPRHVLRLIRCLDSIIVRSTYPNIELVVVDDGGRHPPLREFIAERGSGVTLVRDDRDVSDSALRNTGAQAASGDLLCFLHDDVEVLSNHWLEELVGLVLQPRIGAVGAKLFYPDGTVQHAGIVAGIGGTVGNVHRGIDRLEPGYFGRAMLAQRFSSVSWACMAVRRDAFAAVGGFDESHLSAAFGDVDFCFRLGEAGWHVAWTPHAELVHHEPKEEARENDGENAVRFAREIRYLQRRWSSLMEADPAYNPNLSLAHESFSLAWPPRIPSSSAT